MPTSTNAELGGSCRGREKRLEDICYLLRCIVILYNDPPHTVRRPGAMTLNVLKGYIGNES